MSGAFYPAADAEDVVVLCYVEVGEVRQGEKEGTGVCFDGRPAGWRKAWVGMEGRGVFDDIDESPRYKSWKCV